MTEAPAAATQPSYRDFIKEAFIDPIRTAIIVDDEYPTIDELLLSTEEKKADAHFDPVRDAKKNENKPRVLEILKFCREQQPTPWLVDVHDGRTPSTVGEMASVSHLESSDLLILDYHLDAGNSGEKAIEILRRLAGNGHFNLVVIYTKDRDETGVGIDRTINDIALGLSARSSITELNPKRVRVFEDKMELWDAIEEGIYDRMYESLDEIAFLKLLEYGDATWQIASGLPEFASLAQYIGTVPEELKIKSDEILAQLMYKRSSALETKMSEKSFGRITIGKEPNQINWIRVDSLFVTVISKENSPSSIPTKLLDALEAWDPVPHRLLMSKMRNALALEGVMAESKILMNKHLQAGWLAEILDSDDAKRRTSVRQNIARHWEGLGGKIEPRVLDFAVKIANYLSKENRQDLFKRFDRHSAYEQKIEVNLQMNIHACSKTIEGHHLTTGHILRIGVASKQCQYWLCLTPACDMEPGQSEMKGWSKRLGGWLPFKAVRLYPAHAAEALKVATRGYHLFLNEDGKTTAYGFSELEKKNVDPTLSWEQFFVKDQGRFNDSNTLEMAVIGMSQDTDQGPVFDKKQAVVVAQLRYEYALNLMQRLGAHLSRVGLDFKNYAETE